MADNIIYKGYIDHNSILVVSGSGEISRLYTPFRVQCIISSGHIPAGAWVYVEEVAQSKEDRLLYAVGGKLLSYHYFRIMLGSC